MAIARPVTKTVISTIGWGWPITDEVNRLTALTTPTPWVGVTYANGWSNYGGAVQPLQYRKIGDIVYLRGSMKGGTFGAMAFNLPAGFRPPASMYVLALQAGGTATYFTVDTAGNVVPQGSSNLQFEMYQQFSITP